jgi:FdhE protein
LIGRDGSLHNHLVTDHRWQKRIQRAGFLADRHPFAREILGFYIHLARFQEDLYTRLEKASLDGRASVAGPPELPELLASFSAFLRVVEKHGPAVFAKLAEGLARRPPPEWGDLLNLAWERGLSSSSDHAIDPNEFLAMSFLQPYAEFVRTRAPLQLEGYTHALCPFCSRKPGLAVLRPLGEGARRNLLCGFCLCEWEFRRIVCAGCGEENHAKLPVYTAEEFPYIRVECCDTCHSYLKSIDLSKNGLADPLVDELAAVPLDLWAQEHGYAKLRPNLLGM